MKSEWFTQLPISLESPLLLRTEVSSEAGLYMCSYKKVFRKYAANLQETTHTKVWFQYSCKAALLKSHFSVGILL